MNLHPRRSIRIQGFDYTSENSYFVTFVTRERVNLLGLMDDGKMILSPLGEMAQDNWLAIPNHFPNVDLDEFVIMPNHLHAIIHLFVTGRGTIYRAPTEAFGKPVIGSIPTIIRTYKASVSRTARKALGITDVWQRNYFEHIIRDDSEYEQVVEYIHTNPLNWMTDNENLV